MVVLYSHFVASDWSCHCRAPLALPLLGRPSSKSQPQIFFVAPNPNLTLNLNFPSSIDGRSQSAIMTLSRPNARICVMSNQAYMDPSLKMLLPSVSRRRYKTSYVPTSCKTNCQSYHYLTYPSRIISRLHCEPLQWRKHDPRECQPSP